MVERYGVRRVRAHEEAPHLGILVLAHERLVAVAAADNGDQKSDSGAGSGARGVQTTAEGSRSSPAIALTLADSEPCANPTGNATANAAAANRSGGSGPAAAGAPRALYDPAVVSYEELLEVFWGAHDGRARAPAQYASHAFATPAQREAAGAFLARKAEDSPRPVATTIREPQTFHRAEWYHQSYKKKNRARIALVVASLAVGALPAGMGFAGQEALRQALLGAAVVSTLPQLLSSVFDPLFDALERR
eukprot:PRCOL_00006119-RA